MALVRYACETCGRIWDTSAEANACQATHQNAVTIAECRYRKKAAPEKYPSSIMCTMADGENIVYYIGRASQQAMSGVEYTSQNRNTQNNKSVRNPA